MTLMTKKDEFQRTLNKWWRFKLVGYPWDDEPLGRVERIKVTGPPSAVYCMAKITLDNGRVLHLPRGDAYRPRKKDLKVFEEEE